MWTVPSAFSANIGGNIFINVENLVVYKGEPLFRLARSASDGTLGIDFDIYNAEKQKVATIRRSIVVSGDEKNYEITSGQNEYTVRERSTDRQIASIKRKNVEGYELDVSVELYTKDGFLFNATPQETNASGNAIKFTVFKNLPQAITIHDDGSIGIG